LSQGHLPYDINSKSAGYSAYQVRDASDLHGNNSFSINANVQNSKWVIKNVPAIKEESFTSTIANHIAKIEFQLSEYRFPNQPVQAIMQSWSQVADKLYSRTDFGIAFTRANDWLTDDVKKLRQVPIIRKSLQKIFEFIRDNFTSTSSYGIYLNDNTSLKDIFKRKSGKSCELNLLLLAMLRHENIACKPILMSAREHGMVHELYPLMDRFNYLIVNAEIDGVNYFWMHPFPCWALIN